MFDLFWWHAMVLLVGGFLIFIAAAFPLSQQAKVITRALIGVVLFLGLLGYTRFFRLHGGRTYHYSEIYHYYMGSKYYKEVSHQYLYVAFVGAFADLGGPVPDVHEVRDLENPFHMINVAEAHWIFLHEVKPRFTPQRWEQFKQDVRDLLKAPWTPGDWLSLGDVGYNPPPTYGAVAGTLASLIRPTPGVITCLPFLDWALVCLAAFVVFRTFGFLPMAAYLLIFLTNDLAGLHWIGGGFCRMFWFVSVTLAFCAMERGRFVLAGLAFGFATGLRVFPFVFLFGACLPLFWECFRAWRGKEPLPYRPLVSLLGGAGAMLLVLVGVSLIKYSPAHWLDFAEKIGVHGKTFFVMHLGYDKVATGAWKTAPQYFSDLANFERWNRQLTAAYNAHWLLHRMVSLLFVAGALLASFRSPPYIASLLVGETILFFYALPANYYYIYLALFCAVVVQVARTSGTPLAHARYWLLLLFVVWCNVVGGFSNDWIVLNGWINLALFTLLFLYIVSLLIENTEWRTRPVLVFIACLLVPLALITFRPRVQKITAPARGYVELAPFTADQSISGGRGWMQDMVPFGTNWLTGKQLLVEAQADTVLVGRLTNSSPGLYQFGLSYTAAPDYARVNLELLGKSFLLDTVSATVQNRTFTTNVDLPKGPNYFLLHVRAWDTTRKFAGFNSFVLRPAAGL